MHYGQSVAVAASLYGLVRQNRNSEWMIEAHENFERPKAWMLDHRLPIALAKGHGYPQDAVRQSTQHSTIVHEQTTVCMTSVFNTDALQPYSHDFGPSIPNFVDSKRRHILSLNNVAGWIITEFGQPFSTYKTYQNSFPRIQLSAGIAQRKTKTLTLSIAKPAKLSTGELNLPVTEMGILKLSNDRLTERFALKNSQTS
ncbi:hypothetical protein CLF_107234 [Clonorchis sinensis]|uniref:Uncharacterized protein n=1 Tax=Clonorchis sinensis TaxID=79923 RepID=G7YGE0_CLOSI|nr:hypothetical protein CLF_107234 [Clonorchis sinensis]